MGKEQIKHLIREAKKEKKEADKLKKDLVKNEKKAKKVLKKKAKKGKTLEEEKFDTSAASKDAFNVVEELFVRDRANTVS